ncbi:MAG: FtsX-like permease family protein [Chloroflexota bacterium]
MQSITSTLTLTLKRLWSQRGLTSATLLGLSVAVALIMTVPLYADAVNFRILQEELSTQTERNNRPPFAYLYNYIGAWNDPVEWEAIQPVTQYLEAQGAETLGLPSEAFVWHVETNTYRLFPEDGRGDPLLQPRFGTTSRLADEIELLSGEWPTDAPIDRTVPIEVLITAVTAQELNVTVGARLDMVNSRPSNTEDDRIPVVVSGIWQPMRPDAAYWFYAPTSFDEILTVSEGTYSGRLASDIDQEAYLAVWYLVLDGSRVGTQNVDRLVAGAQQVERRIDELLRASQSLQSPVEALTIYRRSVAVLTRQLLGFNAPTIGLVLAFIGLVIGLTVGQRRNEMAIMRSRGGTPNQLISMAVLEGILLGLISFTIGTLLAFWLTGQMGRVRSFLDFSAETDLRIAMNQATLIAGGIAILFAIIAQIVPVTAVSNDTIITYKLEQARQLRPPWWQRSFLDVILFGVSAYGFYQLQNDGSLFATGDGQPTSVLENPLLLLLPTVANLAVTLIFLRFLPWLMRLVAGVLTFTKSVGLLQAARYLARSPGFYSTPLVLLTLTVSLSVFTASLARTFDLQLFDQWYYQVGADMNLLNQPTTSADNRFFAQPVDASTEFYLPPSAYESIDGIEAASRVGRYPANIRVGDQFVEGEFLGIDRDKFGEVVYWRWDFSEYRLGSLMNALARSKESIIVPTDFLTETGLSVGDIVPLDISAGGGRVSLEAEIVAAFEFFPTYYPGEGEFIYVGNLSTVFEEVGGELPYRVWIETAPEFDEATFQQSLNEQRAVNTVWRQPQTRIEEILVQPQRQGVFGLLSVGFVASALLTVLGFFLYAVFSFRRRMIELGVLRAVGLSVPHMMRFVAWELALLILSGLGLGTGLGVWISQQFVPFLQTGRRQTDFVPPYLVEIAWPAISQVYILFGLLFLLAFGVLSLLLWRMRIFEAIKLGETV